MSSLALQALGLRPQEARLYELLLPLGEVPIADLTAAMKEHPQIVYRLIERLAAQHIVIVTTRKHRRFIKAEDPKLLIEHEAKKLADLRQALPDLLALQKTSKDAIVRLSRGNEAIRALRMKGIEHLPPGDTYYIIGGSGDRFYTVMGKYNEQVESLRIKKKIKKYLITFKSQKKSILKHERWKTDAHYRFLPQSFPIPSSTNIAGNLLAIIIWTKDPIVIEIESKEVAESYRNYFTALWKTAKA